ncbi:MAG: HAMP domain-containing sensor histidine kinase [Byssovorax sp.]
MGDTDAVSAAAPIRILADASGELTVAGLARVVSAGLVGRLGAAEAGMYLVEGEPARLRLAGSCAGSAGAALLPGEIGLDGRPPVGASVDLRLLVAGERALLIAVGGGESPPGIHAVPLQDGAAGEGLAGALLVASDTPLDGSVRDALASMAKPLASLVELARLRGARQREARVIEHTEKVRALGEMAAGVVHDLRNAICPISLHGQLLRRALKRNAPQAQALEVLDEIDHTLARSFEIIDRFRSFSRSSVGAAVEPIALATAAQAAAALARTRAESAVSVEILEDIAQTPHVRVRGGELISAIYNLLDNAIEAMSGGGVAVVRTGAAEGGAWVEVADDGPGIPADLRRRIFEPFFTTKRDGTGLGLSIVHSFVQDHGGRVTLADAEPHGARFKLWFPAAQAEEAT